MDELLESIRKVGIKVPLAVYPDRNRYFLIDGERRWRCAKKLNLDAVPVIIQPKPTPLENLLMMFNIHNVRLDWELMPMALKVGRIRQLLDEEGRDTSPKALAGITGVRLPTIRRALDLLDLPRHYQDLLLKEAEKPRKEQRFTADLFIEIYKSLHVLQRYQPALAEEIGKQEYVESMFRKYRDDIIQNVVDFRLVSKIARAERAGGGKVDVAKPIRKLVESPGYSIRDAFRDTVERSYERRDFLTRIKQVRQRVEGFSREDIDPELKAQLVDLREAIGKLVGRS